MDQQGQINTVIVKINMDGTKSQPRFVVEEVKAQPGSCFEGAENLLRARFKCICCKTGYVVMPLIVQTKPVWKEMDVLIAREFQTPIKKETGGDYKLHRVAETGSSLNEAVDTVGEPKQSVDLFDIKMETDQDLENSINIGPVKYQSRVDQMTNSKEVIDSDEEQKMTFPIKVDPDSVEAQPVKKHKACVDQVKVEARKIDAPAVPVDVQKQNIEGRTYTCDICKASIKNFCSLYRHMKVHMGIRNTCSICQESFNYKSSLNRHKKKYHQNPTWENFNGIDFPCIYCDPQATFKSFDKLKEHIRVTHRRNFACTLCPKAVYRHSDMRKHIEQVHEKKRFSSGKTH